MTEQSALKLINSFTVMTASSAVDGRSSTRHIRDMSNGHHYVICNNRQQVPLFPRIYPWLTHLPRVPHICIGELGQLWFRLWLGAEQAPSHYMNQSTLTVNRTLRNKLQWNLNRNTKLSFMKMDFTLSSGKWRPFCLGLNLLREDCDTFSASAIGATAVLRWAIYY